ncbi:hypothetical protein ASPZODRAFT_61817 [Penicilliopsis zonata CBS 506.65]|uniref:PABS domain-containing protein n=1 Tax=Penicilliopsis zonata CBS 506.65 TaxID=1073090 RepID=A0A1L9SM74_9EURO|nr:hypothetical protein ASPZODRAFT_61817 [Penicilliopsis zonata CBS 506.65]OJJ48325.1 hypothetical protein ASPZODRAFT_61817 [Penicilliopsis zonata CBS 506.65]
MAPSQRAPPQQINWERLARGLALLFLAAAYSPVIVLTLSPVYGSYPSTLFHVWGTPVAGAAGWFLKDYIIGLSRRQALYWIPVVAFWIPTVEYFLSQLSTTWGTPAGPAVTEMLTYYPLILLSVACGGKLIQSALDLKSRGDVVAEHVPFIGSYIVYAIGEKFAKAFIAKVIGSMFLFSSTGLQILLAILYAATVPSKWLLLAIPSILFTLTSNVHLPLGYTTAALNSALADEGYHLIARQESTTGYISVLDNLDDGFRVMRCDHSLLGGQWTNAEGSYNPVVPDPIYAVFATLEAIRLVETEQGEPRTDAYSKALVIGLGVGTTPAALINHGIETTIVEIDPVVHKFATEYFHLPRNHIAVIDDAQRFVQRSIADSESKQYDYIVHDVFTGGVEPLQLFTLEFFKGLDALLSPDGVIAINYAGDITRYPAALIVRTIRSVFPTCRIFREAGPSGESDFTNMVIFCKKATSTPLKFRAPVEADFLRSKARKSYLVPENEIDVTRFDTIEKGGRRYLVSEETERLKHFQDQSAIGHWTIMRNVLPDAVWESW